MITRTTTTVTGLNFTAVDFETANGFRGSPCSVGLVRIRDGEVADTAYWLMRPPSGFDRFDSRNVRIHGITADQVKNQPRFADIFPQMRQFMGDDVLIAHNAGFDLGVIESALEVSAMDVPNLDYACSLMLARRSYQLASYSLPSAAAEAGYQLTDHHNALADAAACAQIIVDVAARTATGHNQSMPEAGLAHVLEHASMQVRRLHGRPSGSPESRATRQARAMADLFDATVALPERTELPDLMRWPDEGTNPEPSSEADPLNPLFDQHVVFTGNLAISRQDAKNRAAALGARAANRVSAGTTMLIVGDGFHYEDLNAAHPTRTVRHRKMRDALHRRANGQPIVIVSEPEFLQMLDGNWPDQART